jgi:uncharacterized membrane protein
MQFISAKPLIEKYQRGTFDDATVGPYFMAYMVLMAVSALGMFMDVTSWDIFAGVLSVVITVFGVFHLKRQNQGTYGRQFLSKYFTLGWIVSIRMLLIVVPFLVFFSVIFQLIGGDEAAAAVGAVFTILFEVAFYWWLGLLIAQSSESQSEQCDADGTPAASTDL